MNDLAYLGGRPRKGDERMPPDDEMRNLLRLYGSFGALARAFGVSKSTVSAKCRRLGLRSPRTRTGIRECAVCSRRPDTASVLRFGLFATIPGRGHQRYAGSLDLCHDCWNGLAKRRRRPSRALVPFA
jgi:hypothetical protein